MKILHVIEGVSCETTGQVSVLIDYIKYQSKKHSVDIYTVDDNKASTFPGLRNLYLLKPDYNGWKYSSKGVKTLRKIIPNYNYVHIHGIWTHIQYSACNIAYKNKIPFTISLHGMISNWFFRNKIRSIKYNLYLKFIANRILYNASLIHTLSNKETNEFLVKYPSFKEKIIEIPNGIKLNKKQVPDYTNNYYLLFLGRLAPVKGVDILIKSWKKVYRKYKNVDLMVIGEFSDKKYKKIILNLIENNPQKYRIIFKGAIYGKEKWEYLNACKAFILPSRTEASSISLLEAASIPLPLIVTENAVLNGMKNEQNVIIVKSNPGSIANGIDRLFQKDINALKKMLTSLNILILDNYNIEHIVKKMTDSYFYILNKLRI